MTYSFDKTLQHPERIPLLDSMRGFAVLGIFWVNVVVFGMPDSFYLYPTLFSNANIANLSAWIINDVLVEGSMRALFSVLFGASAMIFLDKLKQHNEGLVVIDRFYRRNLLLIAFGMFHAYVLLWPYDVLYAYGLLGMMLFPLRKLSVKAVWIIAVVLLVFNDIPIMPDTADSENKDSAGYVTDEADSVTNDSYLEYLTPQIDQQIQLKLSDYSTLFLAQIDDVVDQQSSVMYSTHFFDMGGMMLLGVGLYKSGILIGARSTLFYLLLMLISYSIGMTSRGLMVVSIMQESELSWGIPLFDGDSYSVTRLPMVLGHISLIILLSRIRFFNWLYSAMAVVGRLALTHYLMQSAIAIFIFYGFGLAKFAAYERYELMLICLLVWLFQIAFSYVWLHYYLQGPLEWLWRTLIDGQVRPLKRC